MTIKPEIFFCYFKWQLSSFKHQKSQHHTDRLGKLPNAQLVLSKGYDLLLCTEDVDEFCLQMMHDYKEKEFKNINAGDLGLETEEEKKAAVKDFALTKGLLVALLAGVMSACFNLGLESGAPILEKAKQSGASELFALNPVILLVTIGGFITNASYCLFQNVRNETGRDYFSVSGGTLLNNVLFCALAGVLWYSQFFGLGMGKSYFAESPVMLAFSWSILMSLNVIFSNVWGIILKEWKGVSRQTIVVLVCGMCLLIFSLLLPNLI